MATQQPGSVVLDQPKLPVCFVIPDGRLAPGSFVVMQAVCPSETGRFRVDFYAGDCQHVPRPANVPYNAAGRRIALHFNARLGEGANGASYVLMNSYDQGAWQADQRSTPEEFPFVAGRPFRLTFAVDQNHFAIVVDDHPRFRFELRSGFRMADITRVHIEGPNLEVHQVQYGQQTVPGRDSRALGAAVEAPPVPFFRHDPGLGQPTDIHLAGTILEPFERYFVINLARTGGDAAAKKTDIPLHVSVRAQQAKIIRNTLKEGVWGQEENCMAEPSGEFPLRPGATFDMVIQNRTDAVTVLVNGQLCFEYRHRHDPRLIDTLEINGSVGLTSLRYEFIGQ